MKKYLPLLGAMVAVYFRRNLNSNDYSLQHNLINYIGLGIGILLIIVPIGLLLLEKKNK